MSATPTQPTEITENDTYHPEPMYLLDDEVQVMSTEDNNEISETDELPPICVLPGT